MPFSPHLPRVLHVVISLQPGGLEKLVAEWTLQRNRSAPGSTVVCCLDSTAAGESVARDLPMVCLDSDRSRFPWDRNAVRRLRDVCRGRHADAQAAFDVVHSHNLAAWQYAALANRRTGVRHVHTEHGSPPCSARLMGRWRIRWLDRQTDHMVAVSEATAAELVRCHGLRRDRLTVIPNGIPVHEKTTAHDGLRRRVRAEFDLSENALVLGSVGRLAPIKGYDRLIAMFSDVRQRLQQMADPVRADVYLLLVGDGPERSALQQLAVDHGVQDRIRFAGHREDARELLSAMDLFLLPSRGEGLSLALLEAMAAGVPVLVADAGDSRRVIADGAAGILLPDSTQSWPRVIAEQLAERNSPATKQRIAAAVQRGRNHYTLEKTLEEYERVYS